MVNTRPHTLKWRTKDGPVGESPEGYPIPGIPGQPMVTPCRFHLGGNKEYKNEDSTIVNQIGTIRVDAEQEIPEAGMFVVVEGHFQGIIKAVYRGQLSHRIEV